MAASKVDPVEGLQKILTCSICLDILNFPKTLPCTHSYCEQCLVQNVKIIQQSGQEGILCPQCRTFFKKGEYLQLYVLRELLEFYSLLNKPQRKNCQLCDEGTEIAAVWTCVNCKTDLCEACQRRHKRTPNCKAHTYRPCDVETTLDINCYCEVHPDHVIDLYCVDCNKCICPKCKVTDHDSHKSETIAAGIERLTPVMNKTLESFLKDIEELKYEETCLKDQIPVVKTQFQEVKEEYQKSKDTFILSIEKQYQAIVQTLDECEQDNLKQIEVACEKNEAQKVVKQNIVDICKTTLVTATGCSLLKGLTEGLMQKVGEEENNPVMYAELKLKHPVFEKNPDIVQGHRFLKEPSVLNEFKVFFPWRVRQLDVTFNEIMSQVGECVHKVRLQGNPYRLCVVDSDIWIPSVIYTGGYYEVFNISTKTLQPRKCDALGGVNSFCETHTGHVIAACSNGLFTLNTQGELQYKLADGFFTDVCTNGEKIFAVQHDTCKVQVYTLTCNRSSKETEFLLKDGNNKKNVLKTLHVVSDFVYVSHQVKFLSALHQIYTHLNDGSRYRSIVYKYSLQGEFLEKYGSPEEEAFVSGTDSEQALIVCSCTLNDSVQIRSRQKEWKQYTLKGVQYIKDLVTVGEFLFVLHRNNSQQPSLHVKIVTH